MKDLGKSVDPGRRKLGLLEGLERHIALIYHCSKGIHKVCVYVY